MKLITKQHHNTGGRKMIYHMIRNVTVKSEIGLCSWLILDKIKLSHI